MTLPRMDSVAALYALQNSMMLTPCAPSAGPTGGAGLAAPASICSLIKPVAFFVFLGAIELPLSVIPGYPTTMNSRARPDATLCGHRGVNEKSTCASKFTHVDLA